MATQAQINAIAGLYVAYFDRAPDPAGLQFWIDQLDAGRDFSTISQDFANSAEAQAIYPYLNDDSDLGTISPAAFVTNIYANLFGRVPEQAGLDFWVGVLESGAVSAGDMVEAVSLGARDDPEETGFFDRSTLDNKIECALYFTEQASGIASFPKGDQPGEFSIGSPEYLAAVGSIGSISADASSVADCMGFVDVVLREFIPNSSFTLCEAEITISGEEITKLQSVTESILYWGGTPSTDQTTGEVTYTGGIPADAFFGPGGYFQSLALQDFAELDVIDTDLDEFSIIDWSSVTSVTLSPNLGGGGAGDDNDVVDGDIVNGDNDGTVNFGTMTVTYPDGSSDDIALGQDYFNLLYDLIIVGEDGAVTRFDTRDVAVGIPVYVNAAGDFTTIPQPGQEPVGTTDMQIRVGTGEFEDDTTITMPIVLTPTENNGGTKEAGFTSDDNDFIQVGQVDLLHGAIIDGGGGFNTLEIDAKGHFAQPKALNKIQQISIENLPNVYTIDDDNGTQYPDVVDSGDTDASGSATLAGDMDTIIDISRATDLENLTVTEGDYIGLDTLASPGGLNVVGMRNDATLTLQGAFTELLYVQTSEGNAGDGFTVILENVNVDSSGLFIAQNSPKLNIVSEGGANYLRNLNENEQFSINGHLVEMDISGSARLVIESDLAQVFEDDTPVSIDASANTGGVDLNLTGGEHISFTGSKGDDRFSASTADDSDTSNGSDYIPDSEVTITNGEGDNSYDISTKKLTLTDGDGDIEVEANTEGSYVTLGGGNNIIAIDTSELSLTVGDGDNIIDVEVEDPGADENQTLENKDQFDKVIDIVAGDGENKICVDVESSDDAVVNIAAGDGGNEVEVTSLEGFQTDVTINTGSGSDSILAVGSSITINSGGGNDTITLVGTDNDFVTDEVDTENGSGSSALEQGDIAPREFQDGALLDIDTGSGSATIIFGTEGEGENDLAINNLIAKPGSVITGSDITLQVNTYANLIAAEMTGVTNVILDDDAGNRSDSAEANGQYVGDRAQLTLTMDQFMAIGADNFSVDGAIFNTHSFLKIIVTESTSLTDLGVDDLPRNIDLYFEINDGATLTMTAEQLHTKVARDGITLSEDGNTDYVAGKVVIDAGGIDFDPFNTNDRVQTVINGNTYYGGSLSDDFLADGSWYNVQVNSVFGGYDRPADAVVEVVLTIDENVTSEVGAFDSWHNNLEIIGDGDIEFTGPIQLGLNRGENEDLFTVDFSTLEGNANGLTLGNFEMVEAVYGNSGIGYDTEVLVEIEGNSLDNDPNSVAAAQAARNAADAARATANSRAEDLDDAQEALDDAIAEEAQLQVDLGAEQAILATLQAQTPPDTFAIASQQSLVNSIQGQINVLNGTGSGSIAAFETARDAALTTFQSANDAAVTAEAAADTLEGALGSGEVGFENDNVEIDGQNDDRALISQGVQQYTVTVIEGNGVMTLDQGDTATIRLCDQTEDLEVIALRGNWNDTLEILDAAWGLDFELQAGGTLKREGPTKFANVGSLEANFKWYCADTTVDIFHSLAGDTRTIKAGDIVLNNVETANINVTGDAIIESISGENSNGPDDADALATIDIDGTGSVEVIEKIEITDGFTSLIDASDVVGTITLGVSGDDGIIGDDTSANDGAVTDFTFIGAQGGSTLTLCDVDDDAAEGVTIDGGVAGVALVIEGAVDLDESTLTNVNSVELTDDSSLRIDLDDVEAIGPENFNYEPDGGTPASLMLVGLNDQVFSLAAFDSDITPIMVALADDPVITLNPLTDLSGIGMLEVNEGQVLNMTALQFQQLDGAGMIVGETVGSTPTTDFTVNITDWDQAATDYDNPDDVADGAFNIDGITADTITLTMIEDIVLGTDDSLGGPVSATDSVEVIMPDGTTITIASIEDIDGVDFTGGAGTTIDVTDITFTSGFSAGIDAGGFNVDLIRLPNVLVGGRNVDALLDGLPERVVKEIYTGSGFVDGVVQTVILEEGTTVLGDIGFIPLDPEVEIAIFNLIMEGGTEIRGDLILAQADAELTDPSTETPLLQLDLQEVNITSTGTAENILTAKTTNVITGDLTPLATSTALPAASYADNDLLTVNISGDQAFELTGAIVFNSTDGSPIPVNDDDEATATLNVNSSASVTIGELNTSADSVDAVVVNNTGTGDLTVGIDGANVDDSTGNVDSITLNGSATGIDTLEVEGTLDLSDDNIDANWDIIQFENGDNAATPATDDVTVTVTQAQFNAIGVAGFQANGDDSNSTNDNDATLNLVDFDPAVLFDATGLDGDINVGSITLQAGGGTLNPASNLTGVGQIIVPEGGTLELTAAQFQQLNGTGTIIVQDTDGNAANDSITLRITDLTQADVYTDLDGDNAVDANEIFNLSGVDGDANIIVTLGEAEVNLGELVDGVLTAGTASVIAAAAFELADNQTLGLVNHGQADDLNVTGGANTIVNLLFDIDFATNGEIEAGGYDITTLRALNISVDGEDVEQVIDNLASSVTLNLFEDPKIVGYVSDINRFVVIEPGVQVDGLLAFNGQDGDREVRTLTITFQGDGTDPVTDANGDIMGAVIEGDLLLDAFPPSGSLIADQFGTLTLISTGTGDSNGIDGNITPLDSDGGGSRIDNTLLNVIIQADSAFTIGGTIIFNATDSDDDTANLTIGGGSAAPVTIKALNTTDVDIDTLNIANNGTGTLTITGGSDALEIDNTVNLNFSGTGDIILDTDTDATNNGIEGNALETIDASGLTGNLTVGVVEDVSNTDFAFTSGSGVTTMTVDNGGEATNPGLNADVSADPVETGWSFDFSSAAAGSELRFGNVDWTKGPLNIDMGANGILYIDEDTDLTNIDLTFAGTQSIVLADAVTLTLTADQASGLNIIAGPDTGAAGFTGQVVIDDLGNYPDTNLNGSNDDTAELIDYDFSGIMVPASANLFDNDVTLSDGTNLGAVAINLVDLSDGTGTPSELVGQTIRFSNEQQAARVINVGTVDGDHSTNVIWLFDSITAPVNTGDYDADIARVWFLEALVNGANVEDLFTSLPSQILRVDFATLDELPTLLTNLPVARTIELAALTDLPLGLTFSDQDQLESVETLTVNMGGDVTVGDLMIDNVIDNTGTYAGGTPTFDALTFNSVLADDTGDLLAADGFVEEVNVKPLSGNEVGDIGVGTENNIDLLSVTVNTGAAESTNDLTADSGTNVLTGTTFTAGTITFDSDTAGATASFTVTGANDVTVKSLDTSDPDVLGVVITNNLTGGATLTVTGGSPAVDGGTIAGNTEDVNIVVGTASITTFGSVDGGTTYAGVYGETLSLLDLSGPATATINLGVIASVDSEAFTLTTIASAGVDVDGDLADDSDAVPFAGDVTLTLGEADANGAKAPELSATGVWDLDFSAAASAALTITDDVTFNAGGTLDIENADITIDGAVDLSVLGDDLTLTGVTFDVPAGSSLTLTAEQADGLTITGGGDVVILDVEDAASPGTLDFSGIMTTAGDTGTVTVNVDTADGPDVDALPETITLDASLMGVANIVVAGDGTLTFTSDFVGYDRDSDGLTPDDFASITVGAAATVALTGAQADGLVVDGGGTVEVAITLPSSADLSLITAATVTATVSGTGIFDGDFGTADIVVADGADMTVAYDIVTGKTIDEVAAPAGTGIVNVTLDASAAAADLSTIGGDLEDLNAVVTETLTFTGDFDGADVLVDADATTVTLTVDAGLIDGLSVDGEGTGVGDENLVITGLSSNLDVDLSGVGASLDNATADFDADGTFTGDLGPVVVTILDGVTMTASASVVAGATLNKEAGGDGAVAVTLSATVLADASVNLATIPMGTADVTSITVLDSLTFTGVLAGAAVDVDVADGATLSLTAGIINGETVNAAGTTGVVAVDASGWAAGTLDLGGSANYTVTDLGAGGGDDVNVEDVTGTVDVELDSGSATPTITVGATTGATNIDGDNLTVGVTITVAGAGDATVTTIDGNISGATSTGNLTINGGTNDNTLVGGAGNDTITDTGGAANTMTGNGGFDTFVVSAGTSTITDLENTEALVVSVGATAVANLTGSYIATPTTTNGGTATLNMATTGLGVDLTSAGGANGFTINGSTSGEVIIGSGSDDTIDGGAADDTIDGGTGVDDLTGGGGADTFVFASGDTGITVASADTINDFVTGVDSIDTDPNFLPAYVEVDGAANNEATFIGNATASFVGGFNDIYVEYNADGSGNAWAAVDLNASGTLDAGDTFLVLVGVNLAAEIDGSDFI